jgi:ubiquinone/menaquinone biosynthesis C-methylase UbiE
MESRISSDPGLHSRLNAKKWDARAESYDRKRFDFMRFMQRRTIELTALRPGLSFLDLGCGTGWAVRYVARSLHMQGQFYGIDLSTRMIEKAREQTGEQRCIHFDVADAERLPFGDAFFDLVICTNSFHHYQHPQEVLREIHRVLKPGGSVCITDPTTDDAIGRMIDRRHRRKEPEHVRFYSTGEYKSMFQGTGIQYVGNHTITITTMKVHAGLKPRR